ncbi:hypothetical protein V5O39_08125 [Pseudomonas parakoreensis]
MIPPVGAAPSSRQIGPGRHRADSAYAAGYTGKGVKLGIFDQPVYAAHPEFSGPTKS